MSGKGKENWVLEGALSVVGGWMFRKRKGGGRAHTWTRTVCVYIQKRTKKGKGGMCLECAWHFGVSVILFSANQNTAHSKNNAKSGLDL